MKYGVYGGALAENAEELDVLSKIGECTLKHDCHRPAKYIVEVGQKYWHLRCKDCMDCMCHDPFGVVVTPFVASKNAIRKCSCEMAVLMRSGCKCGGV